MIFIRAILIATVLVCAASAFAADAQEVDCAVVRAKVAEHGKLAAYAWALAQGYTPRDISRIRKRCGV